MNEHLKSSAKLPLIINKNPPQFPLPLSLLYFETTIAPLKMYGLEICTRMSSAKQNGRGGGEVNMKQLLL
jgi:hypothetical protein